MDECCLVCGSSEPQPPSHGVASRRGKHAKLSFWAQPTAKPLAAVQRAPDQRPRSAPHRCDRCDTRAGATEVVWAPEQRKRFGVPSANSVNSTAPWRERQPSFDVSRSDAARSYRCRNEFSGSGGRRSGLCLPWRSQTHRFPNGNRQGYTASRYTAQRLVRRAAVRSSHCQCSAACKPPVCGNESLHGGRPRERQGSQLCGHPKQQRRAEKRQRAPHIAPLLAAGTSEGSRSWRGLPSSSQPPPSSRRPSDAPKRSSTETVAYNRPVSRRLSWFLLRTSIQRPAVS